MSRDVGVTPIFCPPPVAPVPQRPETDVSRYADPIRLDRVVLHAAQTAEAKTSCMWDQPAALSKSRYDLCHSEPRPSWSRLLWRLSPLAAASGQVTHAQPCQRSRRATSPTERTLLKRGKA